jgi:hypothetical protein
VSTPQQPPVEDGTLDDAAPDDAAPDDGAPDDSRSGADIAEAIGIAEAGSSVQQVHDRGQFDTSGEAPVEQVRDDPEMTEGDVIGGEGGAPAHNPNPAEAGSGGAQSVVGARTSDRVASGEEPPSGAPFDR